MDNGVSPLFSACQRENESIVQPLLLNGANLNLCRNDGTSCLHEACKNGYYGIVKLLLKSWATVNLCDKNEASPLALACKEGHESVVQFLLDNCANVNLCLAGGVSSFLLTRENGNDNTVSCYSVMERMPICVCKTVQWSLFLVACWWNEHMIHKVYHTSVIVLLNKGIIMVFFSSHEP